MDLTHDDGDGDGASKRRKTSKRSRPSSRWTLDELDSDSSDESVALPKLGSRRNKRLILDDGESDDDDESDEDEDEDETQCNADTPSSLEYLVPHVDALKGTSNSANPDANSNAPEVVTPSLAASVVPSSREAHLERAKDTYRRNSTSHGPFELESMRRAAPNASQAEVLSRY